jgi:hypothetical protein
MTVLCSRCSEFDKPITCFVLESGPCSICKERATIRDQIKQLEGEIAKLKAKHETLTTPMNAIHDPFIHKLPPEIGSHIFRLSLPTLSHEENLEAVLKPWDDMDSAKILRLGGVCRMWRQLAWATPDLWDTLYIRTRSRTRYSDSEFETLPELLPNLVREWLERSGSMPLTIFFNEYTAAFEDDSDDDTVEVAIGLIIEILNLHSRRWKILKLTVTTTDTFRRFSGSIQPNQLVGLGLWFTHQSSQLAAFMMESELTPTHIALNFHLIRVNLRWDKITHLTAKYNSTIDECIDVLRRAPSLEYYEFSIYRPCGVSSRKSILHPRLRSLQLSTHCDIEGILGVVNLPSLEEWTHNIRNGTLPVAAMLSLFKRSGCKLKVLHLTNLSLDSKGLNTLLQAIPSLERIWLSFASSLRVRTMMHGILARIFCSPPGGSNISGEDPASDSFLPRLQFMECTTISEAFAPFSWDHIPPLYRQGHRRSLTLSAFVYKLDIDDATALQLLQLADEGLDFQIFDLSRDRLNRDFFKNFRERICEQVA